MIVFGLESSCDETAAALLADGRSILSSVVSSQVRVHRDYGGVVPELASREHLDNITLVVERCFEEAAEGGFKLQWQDLSGIAATRGPGLIGALLVGMAFSKALAYALKIPFVGVNHLEGHICSVFLDHPQAEIPALSLVVSGGHTNLYYVEAPTRCQLMARSRDDAAGEALDKLARRLGLGYPGGPVIDRLASHGNPDAIRFALPRNSDGSLDFSFSGLKTAALRHIQESGLQPLTGPLPERLEEIPRAVQDLVASYQRSLVDQLLDRLDRALELKKVRSIQISGGVSCNSELRSRSRVHFEKLGLPVYVPRPSLTTDNAAMIAAAGSRRLAAGERDPWTLTAEPSLPI